MEEITLEDLKSRLQDYIRERRKIEQSRGIKVNGITIRTDSDSVNNITDAITLFALDDTLKTIDFEYQPELWVELKQQQIQEIGIQVGRHIQNCFTNQMKLSQLVNNLYDKNDRVSLENFDILKGW
jgi:hypothetical protein